MSSIDASQPLLVVVHALSEAERALRGKERVEAQRKSARAARTEAARLAGAGDARFEQADDGKPLPAGRWHWSVSHGGHLVAAVVHTAPIGVDVEPIADRRPEVIARVVRDDERLHLPQAGAFTRAWTAKEAVLKATQLGISGLQRCRVVGVETAGVGASSHSACAHWLRADTHDRGAQEAHATALRFDEVLVLELDGRRWHVLQLELQGHVVAVTVP